LHARWPDVLRGPRLVHVERGEGERRARPRGAQRALRTAAEERYRLGHEVGGERAERAAPGERIEQRLGGAPEPGAPLEPPASRAATPASTSRSRSQPSAGAKRGTKPRAASSSSTERGSTRSGASSSRATRSIASWST